MRYTYDQPDYLDKNGLIHLVDELRGLIEQIVNGNLDVSVYATKEELSAYAKTTDIPTLEGYATKSYVDENIANVTTGGEVDLSNYVTKDTVYTKEETDAKIVQIEPITEDEIRALFTSEGLATQTYVDNAVSNVPTTDLTGYATETYVDNKVDSIPTTDLSNYYTKDETYSKTEVDTLVANSGGSSSGEESGGTEEGGGETTTPTGTSVISGNTTLKCGFTRTYTGTFYNADKSEATDVTGKWTITAPFAESSFTTKTISGNKITLGFEDENLIDQEFTLTFSDPNGNYTSSTITVTCADIM